MCFFFTKYLSVMPVFFQDFCSDLVLFCGDGKLCGCGSCNGGLFLMTIGMDGLKDDRK